MSLKVLVIPENGTKDQYVLKPIVKELLSQCGKPKAKVDVSTHQRLNGIDSALNKAVLGEIFEQHAGMVSLFLLCVDRDGETTRRARLDALEEWAKTQLGANRQFFATDAWQELEVWILAGHDLPAEWAWTDVRAEIHPKEKYFLPLAESHGVADQPGEGRRHLAEIAAGRYDRIRQLCPEDVIHLEDRVRDWLSASA